MQPIKKVALLGAEAMGSFFASRFSDVSGFSTSLVAGGERGERLVRDSLIVNGKISMLQDMEAGRKTEVEVFAGKVVALAKQYNVPAPANETFLRIIQVMENRKR
jgi:ketopantoate reductase